MSRIVISRLSRFLSFMVTFMGMHEATGADVGRTHRVNEMDNTIVCDYGIS
jgi:hypothetical protein